MVVGKEFTFHAAHRDELAPEGDQCGRLHGHTYKVRIEAFGDLDSRGMVIHGDVIKEVYRLHVEPKVEHQYLNGTLPFNPTMEYVCRWIMEVMREHLRMPVSVTLWETPTMFAQATS